MSSKRVARAGHPHNGAGEPTAYYNEGQDRSMESPSEVSHRTSRSSLPPSEPDSSKDDQLSTGTEEVGLKKKVGLISGISFIVGTMIGSGIFVSPTGVASGAGSVGLSLILWLVCGILAMLGALAYAELGTMIPRSGGEYSYLLDAFGPSHRIVGPIPAFLFAWMNMLVLKPASVAIIALVFAQYVLEPFYDVCSSDVVAVKCLAALCILVITLVNCLSVRLATILQNVFTVAKILAIALLILGGFVIMGLVILVAINVFSVRLATSIQVIFTAAKLVAMAIIIIGGFVKMGQGYTQILSTGFEGTSSNIGGIAIGLYNGMWAYDGWNNLNYIVEELIDPVRNLPRAIMIAIPLVTVCYLLANISYFTVMTVPELIASPAVAVTWADSVIYGARWLIPLAVAFSTFGSANGTLFSGGRLFTAADIYWNKYANALRRIVLGVTWGHRLLGVMSWIIPVFVACSTFGAVNGTMFSTGRLTFVAAREGHMVKLLSMVHCKRYTPAPSLVFTCILAIIFVIPGDIGSLIDLFSFAVWLFYAATMAALIVLRFTMKDTPRPYKVPIIIPIIVLILALFLVIAPIIDSPQMAYLYAAVFIVGGLIFYVPFVHFKLTIPGMEGFTTFFQLLMECSPVIHEPSD